MPFSGDPAILRQALISHQARGRTALYDALKGAFDHLEEGRLDKKTLVLISDGGDNASELSRNRIIERAELSLATIYTIGVWDSGDRDRNPGFLRESSKITGGESFVPQNMDQLVPGSAGRSPTIFAIGTRLVSFRHTAPPTVRPAS